MFKIIIDANVWIKYARAKDIAPLLNHFTAYNILALANNYLLAEIFDAVIENEWMNKKQANSVISYIRRIAFIITEKAVYGLSPDAKDNYLFDLAIQNNCAFIISDDSELLKFKLKPLPVYSTAWFLKKFPIN